VRRRQQTCGGDEDGEASVINRPASWMQPRSLLADHTHDSRDYTDQSGKNMDSQYREESGRFEEHSNPIDFQQRLRHGPP